jgi:hypothetical protein
MEKFKHFAVWGTKMEGAKALFLFTALDWDSTEPEEQAATYDLGRAIIAYELRHRRAGKDIQIIVKDRHPRQWGEPGWKD